MNFAQLMGLVKVAEEKHLPDPVKEYRYAGRQAKKFAKKLGLAVRNVGKHGTGFARYPRKQVKKDLEEYRDYKP